LACSAIAVLLSLIHAIYFGEEKTIGRSIFMLHLVCYTLQISKYLNSIFDFSVNLTVPVRCVYQWNM